MTIISEKADLFSELCVTELKNVIIVVEGFEPDLLSAMEASAVVSLFWHIQ